MITTLFHVVCDVCKDVVGLVREVESDPVNRPGIYANVSEPYPLPTKCPKCTGVLVRVKN